jgi:hypothetical protein
MSPADPEFLQELYEAALETQDLLFCEGCGETIALDPADGEGTVFAVQEFADLEGFRYCADCARIRNFGDNEQDTWHETGKVVLW